MQQQFFQDWRSSGRTSTFRLLQMLIWCWRLSYPPSFMHVRAGPWQQNMTEEPLHRSACMHVSINMYACINQHACMHQLTWKHESINMHVCINQHALANMHALISQYACVNQHACMHQSTCIHGSINMHAWINHQLTCMHQSTCMFQSNSQSINQSINVYKDNNFITIIVVSVVIALKFFCFCSYNTTALYIRHFYEVCYISKVCR